MIKSQNVDCLFVPFVIVLMLLQFDLGTEFFTLKFDIIDEEGIEIIPAVKGNSLK